MSSRTRFGTRLATIAGLVAVMVTVCGAVAWGQTNPAAQPQPYSNDFSELPYASTLYPLGWQGWTLGTAASSTFRTTAPTGPLSLIASGSASSTATSVVIDAIRAPNRVAVCMEEPPGFAAACRACSRGGVKR